MSEIKSQEILKGFTPYIVLKIIQNEGAVNSYQLGKILEEKSSHLFCLKAPSLIELLATLVKEKLVEYIINKNDKNVQRKIYSLTDKGEAFLRDNQQVIDEYLNILHVLTRKDM